jgi:histidine triad (HIT) family protein
LQLVVSHTALASKEEGMAPKDTIFGKIIRREIPADIVYETEEILAFKDVAPQAPVHILVVPKEQFTNIGKIDDPVLLGKLMQACVAVAKGAGLVDSGYRIVINTGVQAGQTVLHLHAHVLGGRQFDWPPG